MYSHNHNNHDILILPLHTTIHVCVSVKHTPFRYKHQLQRSRVKAQRSTAILCVGRTLVNSSPPRARTTCQNVITRRPTCILVTTIIIMLSTYADKLRRSIINCQLRLFCLFCCILYRTSLAQLSFMFSVWLSTPQCALLCVVSCVLALHSNRVWNSLLMCSIVIHLGCIVP
jgi:hypothetical protein